MMHFYSRMNAIEHKISSHDAFSQYAHLQSAYPADDEKANARIIEHITTPQANEHPK